MTESSSSAGLLGDTGLFVDDRGGSGRPVVLIHGWPLSGESWSEQVPALSDAGYRVVTYDRRGFGRSDRPRDAYDYDTLAADLQAVLTGLELQDATIVGFSMGGGEVARYVATFGSERLRSVVFAAAVPPFLLKSDDNPDGPLTTEQAEQWTAAVRSDPAAFFEQFTTQFFSAGDELVVSEQQRQQALALCAQADKDAVLGCMAAFGSTDFRGDLPTISIPTLVIHGDADGVVPFEGSGKRTHQAIAGSDLHLIAGGPHGCNVSHPEEFNLALLGFLSK